MEPIATNPAEILRTIPLFAKLTDEQVGALAKLMAPEHHHPLSQIVRQGDLGNRFFIIASGTVSKRRTTGGGAESVIGGVRAHPVDEPPKPNTAPNYFGEQMFSSQEPYDFHADAVTEVDLFRLKRSDFDELVKSQRELLRGLEFVRHAERRRTHGMRWVSEGESVRFAVRKHWWAMVPAMLRPAVGLVLLLPLIPILRFFSLNDSQIAFLGIPAFLLVLYMILQVVDWYNDEYIVTNQRVVHVERNLFLQQELRDTALMDKVQGVTIERAGLAGVLLGVSKLVIQSPGRAEGNVTFDYVGNGEEIRKIILQQQDANKARIAAEAREQFRSTVRNELRQYLSPDLVVPVPALAPKKKKRRFGHVGTFFKVLGAPFETEFRYADHVVWRKHWWVLLGTTWRWLGLEVALVALYAITALSGAGNACLLATVAIFVGLGARIVYEWVDWTNDTYAVTGTQIIDAERAPFGLKEKTQIAPLDQITDVVVDVPGILQTILNFGTVRIDTAGKTGEMIFHSIHNPRGAQEEINRRIAEYKTRRAREDASIRSSSVVDAILAYHRLQEEQKRNEQAQLQNPPADAQPDSTDGTPRDRKSDEQKPGSESAA